LKATRRCARSRGQSRNNPNHPGDPEITSAADTPDTVRDVAQAVGELPRKQVVQKLYGLFWFSCSR
jgi:hypothetical protein